MHPNIAQTWKFFQKYVAGSAEIDWSMEDRFRETTRKIKEAASECGIVEALRSADGWAAMVTIINMDEKKYKWVLKEMEKSGISSNDNKLILTGSKLCDSISREKEYKAWRVQILQSSRAAARCTWSLAKKKEHTLVAAMENKGDQPVSLGCFICKEFEHFRVECPINPETLTYTDCNGVGHIAEVCLKTYPCQRSRSISGGRRQHMRSRDGKSLRKNPAYGRH